MTTELGQRLPSGMHGHAHVPATLFLLSASYLGSHSFPTPSSHQGLERGEETSKYILKDLGFLFHVSFCMRFHESPEIPKSRHQQASITENLHSLGLSPKEMPTRSPRPGLQFHSCFLTCHTLRFFFSFFMKNVWCWAKNSGPYICAKHTLYPQIHNSV